MIGVKGWVLSKVVHMDGLQKHRGCGPHSGQELCLHFERLHGWRCESKPLERLWDPFAMPFQTNFEIHDASGGGEAGRNVLLRSFFRTDLLNDTCDL